MQALPAPRCMAGFALAVVALSGAHHRASLVTADAAAAL